MYYIVKYTQIILQVFCIIYCKLNYRFIIKGLENLKNKKGFILASNHVSLSDVIFLISATSRRSLPLFFITKKGILKKQKFGYILAKNFFIETLGAIQIPDNQRNYALSLKKPLKYLNKNYNVVIFPEGKIHREIKINNSKGGLAYLGINSKKPIIPVKIEKKNKIVKLVFGSSIELKYINFQLNNLYKYKQISKKIMKEISSLN